MLKAYYIDTFSTYNLHEVFNSSSLLQFSNVFDQIEYRADISSKYNVEKLLGTMPANINYRSISVTKHSGKVGRLLKQLQAIVNNLRFVVLASRESIVIINYNTMVAIYLINFFTRILRKKVLVVCHGEMYDLTSNRKTSYLFSKTKRFFLDKNSNIANGLYFAVLGEYILDNLKKVLPTNIYEKFFYFDHSAIFTKTVKLSRNHSKIRIGLVGGLRQSKGTDEIFSIVENVLKYNINIEFWIVGSFNFQKEYLLHKGFYIPNEVNGSFITRDVMRELVSQLDYVMCIYPPDIYKYTSSGSFFDAIDAEVPIIATGNDFFNYYYTRYGAFGFIFDDTNKIVDYLINDIVDHTNKFDLQKLKNDLKPERLASQISENIYKLFINHG
jgi:hypothetical protein